MKTRNVEEQLWHLQLGSGNAKHALFGESKAFRRLGVHLDDDLTRQQLAGRRGLSGKRLQLKQLSCFKTWWWRDSLCWSDVGGMHKESPAL